MKLRERAVNLASAIAARLEGEDLEAATVAIMALWITLENEGFAKPKLILYAKELAADILAARSAN